MFDPNNALWTKFNSMLAGRLTLARWYWITEGPTAFGQSFEHIEIPWHPLANGGLLVDNAFDHALLCYGLLAGGFLIVATLTVFIQAVRRAEWNAALFGLTLFTIIGLAETSWFMFEVNYFLIALAPLLYGSTTRTFQAA